MKKLDIEFEEREGKHGTVLGLLMPGGYWVTRQVVEATWRYVCPGLPAPGHADFVTARSMLGEEIWQSVPIGLRIAYGRCIKLFVTRGLLPLTLANPRKKGTRKYLRV